MRALIDGETADCEQVLMDVAYSDGWPVETAIGSFLFLHCDAAPGWSLAGDHNGWAKDAMTAGAGFSWIEVVAAFPLGEPGGDLLSHIGHQLVASPAARPSAGEAPFADDYLMWC